MTSGLSVDIDNEFEDLLREASMLAAVLPRLDQFPDQAASRWLEIAGVAATIEKIYSGCERIMLLLAKRIDAAPIEKTDEWHVTLLKRLARDFPGVRSPILTAECSVGLDRFRSFRHRVRNSYGLALDADIVLDRARELGPVIGRFHEEVKAFLAAWENPVEGSGL